MQRKSMEMEHDNDSYGGSYVCCPDAGGCIDRTGYGRSTVSNHHINPSVAWRLQLVEQLMATKQYSLAEAIEIAWKAKPN